MLLDGFRDPVPIANSQRFFGMLGIITVLTVWPMFFVLHYTGYETFQWSALLHCSLPVLLSPRVGSFFYDLLFISLLPCSARLGVLVCFL